MRGPHIISVCGGKGGIGKTHVSINLAVALAKTGKKVLLIDADIGMANIDVVLRLSSPYTLYDVLQETASVESILIEGPMGIHILPGSSGISQMSNLDPMGTQGLILELQRISQKFDHVILDTGSGSSLQVLQWIASSHLPLVIVGPDPASLADAYSQIKLLNQQFGMRQFHLLVNRVTSHEEASSLFTKMNHATGKFLDVVMHSIGYILEDKNQIRALQKGKSILEAYPDSVFSTCIMSVASSVIKRQAIFNDSSRVV